MALKSDLYTDRVDFRRYFSVADCRACGCASCEEWLQKLRQGHLRPTDCPALDPNRAHALNVVLSLETLLPDVAATLHPVAGQTGLHEINEPGPISPILVTGNAWTTQQVVLAVLSTTTAPFHILFVDCLGHTVDMAMVYQTFTAERLSAALETSGLSGVVCHRELILPGLTAPLREALEARTGWGVRVGPVCIGELPLYLGKHWSAPHE
jgi:CO dehydrogenase/acetyl-CoA synthase gamma subunit (corrinoid Fe-S protein)